MANGTSMRAGGDLKGLKPEVPIEALSLERYRAS
jgi:hypothetical protein